MVEERTWEPALGVDRPTAFDCYRTAQALDRVAELSADIADARSGAIDGGVASEHFRSIAAALRRYLEEATTAVVDGATTDAARELRDLRADVATTIADAESTADHRGKCALSLFDDAAHRGDWIADVAVEAAVRREG